MLTVYCREISIFDVLLQRCSTSFLYVILIYILHVGEELPVSAFCRTSDGEWDAFRSIDMDVEVC